MGRPHPPGNNTLAPLAQCDCEQGRESIEGTHKSTLVPKSIFHRSFLLIEAKYIYNFPFIPLLLLDWFYWCNYRINSIICCLNVFIFIPTPTNVMFLHILVYLFTL